LLQEKNNYFFFISTEIVSPSANNKKTAIMSEVFLLTPIVFPVKVGDTNNRLRTNKITAPMSIFFFIVFKSLTGLNTFQINF